MVKTLAEIMLSYTLPSKCLTFTKFHHADSTTPKSNPPNGLHTAKIPGNFDHQLTTKICDKVNSFFQIASKMQPRTQLLQSSLSCKKTEVDFHRGYKQSRWIRQHEALRIGMIIFRMKYIC
uniref:Uncharacterized protein n=1 Tax=Romanomermis culicivorax TaxID=13658 RepID=A0A915J3J0_ROMCU